MVLTRKISKAGNVGKGGYMNIAEYMTSDPITISSATLLPEARQILNEYDIRHLPVIDGERRLIGIVSDRDLRSAYPSSVTTKSEAHLAYGQVEKSTVEDVMTASCSTLRPEASLDEALVIFNRDKVGGIPVVSEEGVVIGIFSLMDLTAAYNKLFGISEEGSVLITIQDDGRDNILSDLLAVLDSNNITLTRLIRLTEEKNVVKIYMRVNSFRPVEVYNLLKNHHFTVVEP